jgi:predicted neuraminidase
MLYSTKTSSEAGKSLAIRCGCRTMALAMAAFLACSALLASSESGKPVVVVSEFINEKASYPQCHASTIAETAPDRLVAAWFGGTREGNPDVGIWFARHIRGRWMSATEVATGLQADGTRYPTWNPVLFQAPNGPLFLFYKVGPSPREWWGMVMTSTDGGLTWSKARRLPDGVLGPIKDKPVVLPDGDWLSGSSREDLPAGWRVHFELSRDSGRTWELIGPIGRGSGFDAIQPTILTLGHGTLEALCRSKQGVIAMTWSNDGGRTWTPLAAAELPNPNSGIDAVTLKDGRQLLVYNHSAHLPNQSGHGNRYPLDVAISRDGLKWEHVLTLEDQPRPSGYAYPAVIQTSDGLVHITYTWDRKMIKHVVIDPARIQ